jgi:ABC-type sugar transport system substrate-binding protein
MKTSKKARPAFRTAGFSALVAAAAFGQARAADTLNLTDAEKTPAKCDVNYKVGDLGGFKAPKAKKPYKIEFSVPMYIPYIQGLIYGAQLAAKDSGVTLTVDAGQGFMNSAAQITQLENAMTGKPDAVLINPSDPDGMAPTIDDALANGTPVFDVGTLSASEKSNKLVQDDVYQGAMGADAIAKLMPQGGQGIVMGGPPNASWARRRVAGFLGEFGQRRLRRRDQVFERRSDEPEHRLDLRHRLLRSPAAVDSGRIQEGALCRGQPHQRDARGAEGRLGRRDPARLSDLRRLPRAIAGGEEAQWRNGPAIQLRPD